MLRERLCFFILFFCFFLVNHVPIVLASNVVLVPPFENLSRYKAISSYRTNTGTSSDPSRSFTIDRYSEIPRNKIEDILINNGVDVVERQRIDALVLEGDFVTMSGLVDSSKAIELGSMLGANTIVQGSIVDIKQIQKKFSGYGVSRKINKIVTTLRLRIIDIEKGKVFFSKTFDGDVVSSGSTFSRTEYSDIVSESIDSALKTLVDGEDFKNVIKKIKGEKI